MNTQLMKQDFVFQKKRLKRELTNIVLKVILFKLTRRFNF